ncbi:unnamed protein product [Lathyrus sativus]|nr:unnamed protein product [Lathyrus sativus]
MTLPPAFLLGRALHETRACRVEECHCSTTHCTAWCGAFDEAPWNFTLMKRSWLKRKNLDAQNLAAMRKSISVSLKVS